MHTEIHMCYCLIPLRTDFIFRRKKKKDKCRVLGQQPMQNLLGLGKENSNRKHMVTPVPLESQSAEVTGAPCTSDKFQ